MRVHTMLDWLLKNAYWIFGGGGIGFLLLHYGVRRLGYLFKPMVDDFTPVLVFKSQRSPVGGNLTSAFERINGIYSFEITNDGPGTAILGDNPLNQLSAFEVLQKEMKHKRLPKKYVTLAEESRWPNTVKSKESFNRKIGLGHFHQRVMKKHFSFTFKYSDVKGRRYKTKVTIASDSGNVIRSKHMKAWR